MNYLIYLRSFLEIYRSKSITKAAKHLGITQPAASMHAQALEAFIGKELFERVPRGVEPTAAATELYRSVAPSLDLLENKVNSMKLGHVRGGTVHIVGPPDFIHCKLAHQLLPLMEQGYRVRVSTGNKAKIYDLLAAGSVDFAITASLPDEQSHGYMHILTERMMLVYAPKHLELLGHQPTCEQLLDVPLIAYDEDLPLIRTLWASMFASPLQIQAALTIPDFRMITKVVALGQGWTVLPDFICEDSIKTGALLSPTPLNEAPCNNLYLVWNKRSLKAPNLIFVKDYLLNLFASLDSGQ